jgi:5-methylcytosine-specific restriction endonuclease McrA
MSVFKATATLSFTFQHDGSPGQAKQKAEEILEHLVYETDEYHVTVVTQVEKLDQEPPVIKLREYPLDKILSLVPDNFVEHERRIFTVNKVKYVVKITSDRYRLFKKNPKCVACGLEGTRLFLERHTAAENPAHETQDGQAHFNLYGEENGKLILMTKDHIKAKAFGGADSLENYQTMCSVCNGLKASYPLDLDGVVKMREIYKQKGNVPKNELKKSLQATRLLYLTELNGQ